MYTVFRIILNNDFITKDVLDCFNVDFSQNIKDDECWVTDVFKDEEGQKAVDGSSWYRHCEAMIAFVSDNADVLKRCDCDYHFDTAVYSEDCTGVIVKCLPLDNDIIKLFARYNISFEMSLYLPWE